jgi:hypothetical protein
MKATIDIPDALYRRVKAKSAMQGLSIREVTAELYEAWLSEKPRGDEALSVEKWLEGWTRLGEDALKDAPDGPSAREILENDRNRLERY